MKLQSTKKEKPPKFMGRFINGELDFGSYTKIWLKKFMEQNPNMLFELKPLLPESNEQRGWFEGALCPLVTFYQERMDWRNSKDIKKVREWLKLEFNAESVVVGGKAHKIAKSTLNALNQGFLERVTGWVEDNYAPPAETLDPKRYKLWKDTIFPFRGADTYLGYLIEIGILK